MIPPSIPERGDRPRVHRVNVNFSEGAYTALVALADGSGRTISEVLRDAISLEKWVHEERVAGNHILIERDGIAREIVLR